MADVADDTVVVPRDNGDQVLVLDAVVEVVGQTVSSLRKLNWCPWLPVEQHSAVSPSMSESRKGAVRPANGVDVVETMALEVRLSIVAVAMGGRRSSRGLSM